MAQVFFNFQNVNSIPFKNKRVVISPVYSPTSAPSSSYLSVADSVEEFTDNNGYVLFNDLVPNTYLVKAFGDNTNTPFNISVPQSASGLINGNTLQITPPTCSYSVPYALSSFNSVSASFANTSNGSGIINLNGIYALNVINFGAINDGITDNTPAFNNAISVAHSLGNCAVYIPGNNYLCNLTITTNNVNLIGDTREGQYSSALTLRPFNNTKPVIQVGNDTSNVYGFKMENISISGLDINNIECPSCLFLYGGAYAPTITNCWFGFANKVVNIQGGLTYPSTLGNFIDCQISMQPTSSTGDRGLYYSAPSAGSITYTTAYSLTGVHINGNSYGYAIEVNGTTINCPYLYVDAVPYHCFLSDNYSGSQGILAGGIIELDTGGSGQINDSHIPITQSGPFAYVRGNCQINGVTYADSSSAWTGLDADFQANFAQANELSAGTKLSLYELRPNEGTIDKFYISSTSGSSNVFIGGSGQLEFQPSTGPITMFLLSPYQDASGGGGGFKLRDQNTFSTWWDFNVNNTGSYGTGSLNISGSVLANSLALKSNDGNYYSIGLSTVTGSTILVVNQTHL